MLSAPRVTVVLTSYNHSRFIEESVASVLNQSMKDLEVVIIDDASTDDSYDRLCRIKDTRVRVCRNEYNRGRHPRNWVIRNTNGEFVAFQNSDDIWGPSKLEAQIEFLDKTPECGVCFTNVEVCGDNGAPYRHPAFHGLFRAEQHDRHGWLRRFFVKGNCLAHPSAVIRRSVLDQIGLFDPAYFQLSDFDLWVRAATVSELVVLRDVITRFRVHKDSSNVSSPTPSVIQRSILELTEMLKQYGRSPILNDVPKIFGLEPGSEQMTDVQRSIMHLTQLGLFASAFPQHQRLAGVHFLREALRRDEEAQFLTQSERSRITQRLHAVSGGPQ